MNLLNALGGCPFRLVRAADDSPLSPSSLHDLNIGVMDDLHAGCCGGLLVDGTSLGYSGLLSPYVTMRPCRCWHIVDVRVSRMAVYCSALMRCLFLVRTNCLAVDSTLVRYECMYASCLLYTSPSPRDS